MTQMIVLFSVSIYGTKGIDIFDTVSVSTMEEGVTTEGFINHWKQEQENETICDSLQTCDMRTLFTVPFFSF